MKSLPSPENHKTIQDAARSENQVSVNKQRAQIQSEHKIQRVLLNEVNTPHQQAPPP